LETRVTEIIEQLGLDNTFFVQLGLFAALFFILSNVYFKPFLKLFDDRHKRTVRDREAAEKLMEQAESKFDEFKIRMAEERAASRKEYEALLGQGKREEEAMLGQAWAEARKITQEAAEKAATQREKIRQELAGDIDSFARVVADKLLARRG